MRHASETGVRRRLLVLATASALVLSGCISPAFRESVGQFGAATKAAVTAQTSQLTEVIASEREKIRNELATNGVALERDPNCAATLIRPPSRENAVAPPPDVPDCRLLQHGGGSLREEPRFENIAALGNALTAYSDSLIALAADTTESRAAFSASLASLATSAGNLNNAIRVASGKAETDLSAPLGAIAGLVAELGNLYFAAERNRVLRRVITEGEPIIRRAIEVLTETAGYAAQVQRSDRWAEFTTAHRAATDLTDRGVRGPELRTAQDLLFERLDSFNRSTTNARLFLQMATAHRELVRAAGRGASAADIQRALEAVIQLATTAQATITALNNANRSNGNGR